MFDYFLYSLYTLKFVPLLAGQARGKEGVIVLLTLDPSPGSGWMVRAKTLSFYPVKGCYVPRSIPYKVMKM